MWAGSAVVHVAAGVVRDAEGRVLLARRHVGTHQGGLWEFPGGKIDDGESPEEALVRELLEELGLTIAVDEPLIFAVHEEPGLEILLLFFAARILSGEPAPNEGQEIRWVPVIDLPSCPTPPADARLVELLTHGRGP